MLAFRLARPGTGPGDDEDAPKCKVIAAEFHEFGKGSVLTATLRTLHKSLKNSGLSERRFPLSAGKNDFPVR
jgi:hypothetical protein